MITIITGKPGAGKTALNTYFCLRAYYESGQRSQSELTDKIRALNAAHGTKLTVPDKPPIFTNYEVKFYVDYEQWYEPYYINPYYMGLPNDRMETQYIPPGSKIFISEAQRYYNSRKSSSFPDWVSRFYEMHRHYGLEIYLDVQRGKLIDLNIRALCKRFIEVSRLELIGANTGAITKIRWQCREFTEMQAYEDYINGTGEAYTETTYEYNGNIFKNYNSYSCFEEFLPRSGKDFVYLEYKRPSANAGTGFYDPNEPAAYRNPEKPPAKE